MLIHKQQSTSELIIDGYELRQILRNTNIYVLSQCFLTTNTKLLAFKTIYDNIQFPNTREIPDISGCYEC